MNQQQVNRLKNGLYEIKWKSGGVSIASVGTGVNGVRWMAPTNWVIVPSDNWKIVQSVKLIRAEGDVDSGEKQA
jgi:hypothetical protein